MITATAIVSIVVFIVTLRLFGAIRIGAGALVAAKGAVAAMRDRSLDDLARERAARDASRHLFGAFTSIFVRGALTLAASFVPIWLASLAGLAAIQDVTRFLFRWDVMLIATIAICLGYLVCVRLWPSK